MEKWLCNWTMGENWKSFSMYMKNSISLETVGRNVEVKGKSGDDSEGSEEDNTESVCPLRESTRHHEQI